MTCAMEGCKQDNGVVLADDLKPGESADATAQKEDLSRKVKDILDRLGATEALATLLQETVKLHDTRIKLLEDQSKTVDGRLADIDGMIEHHEDEIHALAESIHTLEADLNAKIEEQAALEKAALDQLRADLGSAETRLEQSIASLDQTTKDAIQDILDKMEVERKRVDDADAAVAQTAKDNLQALQIVLEEKIGALQDADCEIRKALAAEISRLDDRVDGVIESSQKEFRKLWTSYGLLQAQLILVALDNALEHQRIRKEIDQVEAKLRSEVGKLNQKDQDLTNRILDLYSRQNQTQSQLDALEAKYNAFVLEQAATHKAINENFTSITDGLRDLKSTLDLHIQGEAARVKQIVTEMLPLVTNRITTLEGKTATLQSDLATLEDSVGDLGGDFNSLQKKHNNLRKEYDAFVKTTRNELKDLNEMLGDIQSCSIETKKVLFLVKVELTCGNKTVTFIAD
jgi:chromosome segregation ATPase